MNTKHTPGPWHWDSDPMKGDPLGRVRFRVTTVGKTITQIYRSSDDERAVHDARLIAAAPEMLAALKEAEKLAWEVGCETVEGVNFLLEDSRGDLYRQISAAIAKATWVTP